MFQINNPTIKEISTEDDDIEVKVLLLTSSLGKYKITCIDIEGSATLTLVNSHNWDTLIASPMELLVDEPVEVNLTNDVVRTEFFTEFMQIF